MCKWQWKVFSVLTMLAMALAMCPPTVVSADWGYGTFTGNIWVDIEGLNLQVRAYPDGGGDRSCQSDWVNFVTDHYEYSMAGCDPDLDYNVVAEGDGYSFVPVSVLSTDFGDDPGETDPFYKLVEDVDFDSTPRAFSGKVTYTDGVTGWPGFVMDYQLDNHDGGGLSGVLTATTNGSGVFTIPGVTDASYVYFPQMNVDGYDFGGDSRYDPPIRYDVTDWVFTPSGTRDIHGYIDALNGLHSCAAGVTITATAPGAKTMTTLTDGDNGFGMNNLEPLGTAGRVYTITASKSGCSVFEPASQGVDISNGNGRQPIVFKVPDTGVWGNVKTTLGDDASLAYYLIATYTTGGVSYSNAVNWTNGGYWIQAPPSTGTLTISRVGGPAAFGYETAGASRTISIGGVWQRENFTLVPSRTISGTILGQNAVPVQRNATVDFGYGLKWTPGAPVAAYSLKAQPKLYFLSPVENGILGSTPARFLANLTTAASAGGANFTVNWRTYQLQGCLRDFNGSDPLNLAPTSTRFRPATGYGTATYPATLTANGCGLGNYRYSLQLPKGIAGAMEVDGHTLRGGTIDGMNWDEGRDYDLMGPRAITGRIYSANPNLDINGDFRGGSGFLILRDAATNYIVDTDGDMQRSHEFTIPMLEAKNYTLSINPGQVPQGYDAQPFPMSLMVPVNLTAGDVDISAATGFSLVHKSVPTFSATGLGYFLATATTQHVGWAPPGMNDQDWARGFDFEVQVGPANATFTDSSPAPIYCDNSEYADDNGIELTGLTVGQLYRWRVRTVYEYDKGPWLETTPRIHPPTTTYYNKSDANYEPGTAAGPVTFGWRQMTPFAGFGQRFTNYASAGFNVTLEMTDTSGFTVGDFVRAVADNGPTGIAVITAITPDTNIVVDTLHVDYDTGYVYKTLNPNKLRYQVQYSDNAGFSAVAPNVTVMLTSVAGAATVNTTTNPAIGKVWYWRIKTQYNTSGTTWVDISGWSPTQMFFNRYKNITASPSPTFTEDDLGWDINPVWFSATDSNTSLPPNAYYQVELHDPSRPDDYYYWTFPRAAHSVYQFPDSLPDGTYAWKIGIVQGNDAWAPLITNWTNGTNTITVVH